MGGSGVREGGAGTPVVRVVGTVMFWVSAFLLTSIGGAGIVASPVTLPLMYVLTRLHPSRAFLIAGLIIGTLTAFEGGWGLGYVVLNQNSDGAALVGLVTAAFGALAFASIPYLSRRESGAG